MKYAIIGFGSAGYHALVQIRQLDIDGEIDVYNNTPYAPYNPMLTTYYADGKINYNGLFPFGNLEDIQNTLVFNHIQEEVITVTSNKEVFTNSSTKQYDRILIATGARSFVPPVAGLDDHMMISMRNIEDSTHFKALLDSNIIHHAIVVGASMTGIKVTEALMHRGVQVTLLDLASHIFPLQSYKEVANEIEKRLFKNNIVCKWQTSIDHMEGHKAYLSNGEIIDTNLVALCIGTRPNIYCVKDTVKINRGIVVDEFLETNVPGIFAAGDCCEANNVQTNQNAVNGLWANASKQGSIAGYNMVHKEKRYIGSMFLNITHFLNQDFIGFGDVKADGKSLIYGNLEDGFYIHLKIKDHQIVSGNILDNYAISGIIANYIFNLFIKQGKPLLPFQKSILQAQKLPLDYINELEDMIYGSRS